MAINNAINMCLDKMHKVGGTGKGVYGELAVLKICELMYQQQGGILYHSYTYKADPAKAGNIKRGRNGTLYIERLGAVTEIDILLATVNRIFAIEVKAYKAKNIILYDDRITGCNITNKSPIHQNEMHCRHLYESIFKAIPNGDSEYIIPVCVFVDECVLKDMRSEWQKKYVYKSTLNNLPSLLKQLDVPGDNLIDLKVLDRALAEACVDCEKRFPLRIN